MESSISNLEAKLSFLIKIRWVAIVSQLAVFFCAKFWLINSLESLPFIVAICFVVLTNFGLIFVRGLGAGRILIPSMAISLLLDVFALAGILYFYGGYANPFSMLFLVHIILCAIFLGTFWTWVSFVISSLLYISLFFWHQPISVLSHQGHTGHLHHDMGGGSPFDLHLYGMLVGFVLIGFLLSIFVTRITRELEILKEREATSSKMSLLSNIAAGAAHEIATPLGTISLITEGLLARASSGLIDTAVKEDLDSLAFEVQRATDILSSIKSVAPELQGEALSDFSLGEIVEDVKRRLSFELERSLVVAPFDSSIRIRSLRVSLVQSLISIVKNGIEASPAGCTVTLSILLTSSSVSFEVKDSGFGVPESLINSLGEPFFTVRESLRPGMGLGLHLAKIFTSYVGGDIKFKNLNPGFLVTLLIPRVA